jgi:hypothetical protein
MPGDLPLALQMGRLINMDLPGVLMEGMSLLTPDKLTKDNKPRQIQKRKVHYSDEND